MIRRLQAYEHGEPADVLAVAELPDDPPPGPGQVTLAVRAVGLNFLDVMLCRGTYPVRPEPPMTPGVEVAGRVVAAGPGAERLSDVEVLACPALPHGALGDTVTLDATLATPLPAGFDPVVAAALPVTYQTAWWALERAGVGAGQTVLVHAGAGGVGIAATQLAVARGARVICTAGGPEKLAVCRDNGAFLAVDYRAEDFVAAVRDTTGTVDVVLDPVGGDVFTRSLSCLDFEGRIVAIGAAGGPPPPVDPMALTAANVTLVGLSWGSAYPWRRAERVREVYAELFALCAAGAVRPPVGRTPTLDEAPAALADLAARRTTGKIVVRLGRETP
ncbi:zinc-binding dehydrogenase [Phytohabitans sp. ZYX-F-186]|uniref:Zinc-binding dehydrogenase n=1 Tax=Phytohabitans maris TaxID=3071409 RepID=A0ABU0ZF14_9ACTN|nr:zinc-binding dehydrogenase [Phytohabitans sp. ZYX-F-186]MDQ7904895.1 zinc-binding dehydrogenase [Phytohabitans sp. ZYX-F-186]